MVGSAVMLISGVNGLLLTAVTRPNAYTFCVLFGMQNCEHVRALIILIIIVTPIGVDVSDNMTSHKLRPSP